MKEAICFFETSVLTRAIRRHIPEDVIHLTADILTSLQNGRISHIKFLTMFRCKTAAKVNYGMKGYEWVGITSKFSLESNSRESRWATGYPEALRRCPQSFHTYLERVSRLCHDHKICLRNRPWRLVRLCNTDDPTLFRQSAHRWRWDCQAHSSVMLYSPDKFIRLLGFISVRGCVHPCLVRLGRLGRLK
jgi:hypothetical protein